MNGELTVDFPEDVKIPIEPNQMVTASVVGSKVKFSYCGLERAIAQRLPSADHAVPRFARSPPKNLTFKEY